MLSAMNTARVTTKNSLHVSKFLSLATHLEGVSSLPVAASGPTDCLGVRVALAQPTRLSVGRGEATHLSVFLARLAYPVDLGVPPDSLVVGVDQDDLEVLVG